MIKLLLPLLLAQSFGTDAGLNYSPSFADFGAITESGSIDSAYGIQGSEWQAGDRPEDLLTLGNIDSLGVGDLTLGDISQRTGIDTSGLTLEDFPLLADSSLEDVADSVGNDPGFLDTVLLDGNTVEDAIADGDGKETLATKLGVAKPLEDIAKVQDAVIKKLTNYKNAAISSIPGLPQLPFASYPAQLANNSLSSLSLFARADLILDKAEQGIDNTVSGSDKEKTKFQTPCPPLSPCGHVELKDAVSVKMAGKRWINGKHQKVRGGSGALGAIFGNKEPTGRLPFGPGSPFKLVLTENNELTDKISFSAYFQKCATLAGCTGYNIGPFPLYSTGIDGLIWLGVNPTQLGQIPIGFDPAVGQGNDLASTGAYSPVSNSTQGGVGEKGKCANTNGDRPEYAYPANGVITSGFGYRPAPCAGCSSFHAGLDVAAPTGTPIVAGEGGTILYSGWAGGLGNAVYLLVECTGHVLKYGHNSVNHVREGEKVRKGQKIASMGSTGFSTGPHSHFVVEINGQAVNPAIFLPGG